jgi:5-methylcytosine-specific restriction protein A
VAVKLVSTKEDVVKNVSRFRRYETGSVADRDFFRDKIRTGKQFVVIRERDHYVFAPSKFAGYKNNNRGMHVSDLGSRDGRITNRALNNVLGGPFGPNDSRHKRIDAAFLRYCRQIGVTPIKPSPARKYWFHTTQLKERGRPTPVTAFTYPEDLSPYKKYPEGTPQTVTVDRWERSASARKACIEHYGAICRVCKFDFEKLYGEIGRGYMHVHHLVPISKRKEKYEVDPIKGLQPVCPNCHAMLHAGGKVRSIKKLKALILSNSMK